MFIFRGKRADRLKIIWWDGQGFCLFCKCFNDTNVVWLNQEQSSDIKTIMLTPGQFQMLLEGIDWRTPKWNNPPKYFG